MWAIRFLNGPLAGRSMDLADGIYSVGRADVCQIQIPHPGISKQHAQVVVKGFSVTVRDLGSANGTYVNGVRVNQRALQPGDKIGFHDILFELVSHAMAQSSPQWSGNAALQLEQGESAQQAAAVAVSEPRNIVEYARAYVDNVVLPGVFRLIQMFEFKWVLGSFFVGFILLVTALSVIPMLQITQASIEKESVRRALTIARNLALINQPAIQQEMESTLSTQIAEQEEGVDAALIVASSDGHIIAPATKAESYADNPFVHRARKLTKDSVELLGSGSIGASVPIKAFNTEMGSYTVKAHAIVLYSMGGMALDSGRTLSLFTQTLLIAFILGGILFFFVYRMVIQPLVELNQQVDSALKEGRDVVSSPYQIADIQKLALNVSSALTRALHGGAGGASPAQSGHQRISELSNAIQMLPTPALLLGANQEILNLNTMLEDLIGMRLLTLQGQNLEILQDQALKLNFAELFQRCSAQPGLISTGELDMNGYPYEIDAQGFSGTAGLEACLIILKRKEVL